MNAFGTRSGELLFWLATLGAVAALIGWETDWGRELTRAPVICFILTPGKKLLNIATLFYAAAPCQCAAS